MFGDPAFDKLFGDTVRVLNPYLSDIICIGGCANALYRHHNLATTPAPAYLGTKDSDWAVPVPLAERTAGTIAELMKKADFEEDIQGAGPNPVVKYRPKNAGVAADIEFLCPLSGIPGGRKKENVSVQVQRGLIAQPLQYLEILTMNPWQVDLGKIPDFREFKGVIIQVPNPAAYIVQKVLIRDQRRKNESKAKDCYYMYEVSVVFRDNLTALGEEYTKLLHLPARWLKRFKTNIRILFRNEHAEGATSALDVYNSAGISGPRLGTDIIQRAVSKMLDAMNVP